MTVTDEDKSFREFCALNILQAIYQLRCHRKLQYAVVWTHEAIRGVRQGKTYISVLAMKKSSKWDEESRAGADYIVCLVQACKGFWDMWKLWIQR